MKRSLSAYLALSGLIFAQEPPCGDPQIAGRTQAGMRLPEIMSQSPVPSTQEAIDRHVSGIVTVCLVIDTEGNPSRLSVVSGLGAGLDEAALVAVRQWHFIPAIKADSSPVKVWAEVTVRFADPASQVAADPPVPIARAAPVHTATFELPNGPELVSPAHPSPGTTLKHPGLFIVLDDSTPVKLRLGRTLSSADARTGDTVDFEVLEEVKVADRIVISKGATAIGTVTNAESKKRMARGGKLDVTIDFVKLSDGEKAALRGVKDTKGGGHMAGMTTGIVATALVFWPAAPLFLFMHGKDITIPKGTEITAYTNGNTTLDGSRFRFDPMAADR